MRHARDVTKRAALPSQNSAAGSSARVTQAAAAVDGRDAGTHRTLSELFGKLLRFTSR